MKSINQAISNIVSRLVTVETRERAITATGTPSGTVAAVPAPGQAGRLYFATNGRKVGEGAGAGTGVLAYDDGVAWRRTSDDTTLAA